MRLYFFVMYNLSGIQKGIQAGHAALEYVRFFGDTPEYQNFIARHKTFILLDGGGSIEMEEREKSLEYFGIPFASFQEPDLNNSISAIAFLLDETIYDFDRVELFDAVASGKEIASSLSGDTIQEDVRKYNIYKYIKSFKLAAN